VPLASPSSHNLTKPDSRGPVAGVTQGTETHARLAPLVSHKIANGRPQAAPLGPSHNPNKTQSPLPGACVTQVGKC
jgi:hypothetical protein